MTPSRFARWVTSTALAICAIGAAAIVAAAWPTPAKAQPQGVHA